MQIYIATAHKILNENMAPTFIDIEATGLDFSSYPIEIAYGNTNSSIESFLINPDTTKHWQHWCDKAQKIHNIPRSLLISDGIDVADAAGMVSKLFSSEIPVFSDNPDFDMAWLRELYYVAGLDRREVVLHDTNKLAKEVAQESLRQSGMDPSLISKSNLMFSEAVKRAYKAIASGRHRAGPDVSANINAFNTFVQNLKNQA